MALREDLVGIRRVQDSGHGGDSRVNKVEPDGGELAALSKGVELHFYSVFSSRHGQHSHCSTDRHQYAFAVFIICAQHCICIPGGVGICFFSKLQTLRCWVGNVSSVSQLCSTSVPTLRIQTLPGRPAMTWTSLPPVPTAHPILTTLIASLSVPRTQLSPTAYSPANPARHFFSLIQYLPLLRLGGEPGCAESKF